MSEPTKKQWMVYGVCIVTADTREEAIAQAQAGKIDEPFEVLNDTFGFFRPEAHNFDEDADEKEIA